MTQVLAAASAGAAIVVGLVVGWLLRSKRARDEATRSEMESDTRFVDMLANTESARREAAEARNAKADLTAELAANTTTLATIKDQLAAQQRVAEQFHLDRDAAVAAAERLRQDLQAAVATLGVHQGEFEAERRRLSARISELEAQLAKVTETAQADRAMLSTETIDLRRQLAVAAEALAKAAADRRLAEQERHRLNSDLSRREAEGRVAIVAQQAAFADFRSELGSLQAQADRAEVVRAQLVDRENLLRSVIVERDSAAEAALARERELSAAKSLLARERSMAAAGETARAQLAAGVAELESRVATLTRDAEAQLVIAGRAEREIAILRDEIKERDVRFRTLLEDRRAVVEASLAEMARLRRELSQASGASETGGSGSFSGPAADDLKRISGIGPAIEKLLHANGITSFRQIAEWDETDIDRVATQLGAFRDRIRREGWTDQARRELERGAAAQLPNSIG